MSHILTKFLPTHITTKKEVEINGTKFPPMYGFSYFEKKYIPYYNGTISTDGIRIPAESEILNDNNFYFQNKEYLNV